MHVANARPYRLDACQLLAAPGAEPVQCDIRIDAEDGVITRLGSAENATRDKRTELALPALVNAHDHGRGLRGWAYGAADAPLETWRAALYAHPAIDPYLVSAVSFGRVALSGCASIVHLHAAGDIDSLVDEALAVCRAARDVGVRLAFVVPMRDRNSFVYDEDDDHFLQGYGTERLVMENALRPRYLKPAASIETAERIAAACEGDGISVQFGPNGPQWCSDELLRRIADASATTGRRVHMHLLETRHQRAWADQVHPEGLIRYLDTIGLLSPRLAVAHGVWLRPDEIALLADRGVTVVTNTSSNLRLGSGRAPISAFIKSKLAFAIGLDGFSLDDDDDALRELRLTRLLHGHAPLAPVLDPATLFTAACRNGFRVATGIDTGGALTVGSPADFITLDWDRLASDILPGTVDPLDVVLARAHRGHVRRVVVAGREIARDGQLTGVDLPALERDLLVAARANAGTLAQKMPLVRKQQDRLRLHFA